MKNMDIQKFVVEKKHRLSGDLYKGFVRATFTLCINNKECVFIDENIVNICINMLDKSIKRYKTKNLVYVFMPDHLHFILEGIANDSDLLKCVVLFKQLSGYWFSAQAEGLVEAKAYSYQNTSQPKGCGYQNSGYKNVKWQKDFYDHIHRKDDDIKKHIKYILDNPVRSKLVNKWQDYIFKGSLNYELDELL